MTITRRTFLAGGAALGFSTLAGFPAPLWAETEIKNGGKTLSVLSDGKLKLPTTMLFDGVAPADYEPLLKKHGVMDETQDRDLNLTLYRDGKRVVLFDVGSGPNFMPTAGKLLDAFDAKGISPDDITDVVFTHAHPDHLWGVFDDFDEPVFPKANYHISQAEWDYWTDENTVNTIGDMRQAFAVAAKRLLTAIADKTTRFNMGKEIMPGIMAHDTSGHTPGHASFEVRLGTESVMVLGDCVGNHHISFMHPDWVGGMDQDRQKAAKTRAAQLNRLADEKMTFIGYHFPYPGIGKADRFGDGFKFIAA